MQAQVGDRRAVPLPSGGLVMKPSARRLENLPGCACGQKETAPPSLSWCRLRRKSPPRVSWPRRSLMTAGRWRGMACAQAPAGSAKTSGVHRYSVRDLGSTLSHSSGSQCFSASTHTSKWRTAFLTPPSQTTPDKPFKGPSSIRTVSSMVGSMLTVREDAEGARRLSTALPVTLKFADTANRQTTSGVTAGFCGALLLFSLQELH